MTSDAERVLGAWKIAEADIKGKTVFGDVALVFKAGGLLMMRKATATPSVEPWSILEYAIDPNRKQIRIDQPSRPDPSVHKYAFAPDDRLRIENDGIWVYFERASGVQ